MHRQIGIHSGRGLLFRDFEQTALEGPDAGCGWHGTANRTAECTGRAAWLLHSAKRDGKRCTPSPATVPSARRQRGRWRHCRRHGEFVARRRCYYAQSACLVVHLDLRSMRSGYFDVWSMSHLHGSVALSCVWRGVEMWHILGVCRRWHGPSSNGLRGSHRYSTGCNLFRDAALCAARERLARSRPLSSRVSTAVREVGCLRRRGDPWAHCGRPQRSGMDTVCPVAAAVAAGRSRAMLRDATWVRQEILAF